MQLSRIMITRHTSVTQSSPHPIQLNSASGKATMAYFAFEGPNASDGEYEPKQAANQLDQLD